MMKKRRKEEIQETESWEQGVGVEEEIESWEQGVGVEEETESWEQGVGAEEETESWEQGVGVETEQREAREEMEWWKVNLKFSSKQMIDYWVAKLPNH